MVEQSELRERLLESLAARGHELEDVASFEDGHWKALEPGDGPSALAILRRFDPAEYARGAAAFVAALDAAAREAWYRAFTRTAVLVGDPGRIVARFDGLIVHATEDMAWVFSPQDRVTLGLRRLLKPLRTSSPPRLEPTVRCELGTGAAHEVLLAAGGLALERYAVLLNHVVCEALITGALEADARVTVRHVREIESLGPACSYVRVVPDPSDPTRLVAEACVLPVETT